MKIICILHMLCFSTVYAAFGGNIGGNFGIGGKIVGDVEDVTHRIVCNAATLAGNVAGSVTSTCKNLPGQNGDLGFVAKSTRKVCTGLTGHVDKYVKKLTTKYCDGGSSTNTKVPTTQSTSTKAPTTQSTSTPVPTTTTSPDTCTKDQMKTCKNICDRYRQTSINFGPKCTPLVPEENNGVSFHCDCIKVKHCETYTNATCTEECQNKEICRIPNRGLPCVCIINPGKPYVYYVLPSQL